MYTVHSCDFSKPATLLGENKAFFTSPYILSLSSSFHPFSPPHSPYSSTVLHTTWFIPSFLPSISSFLSLKFCIIVLIMLNIISSHRYGTGSRIMPYFSHGGIGRHKPRAIDSSVHVTDAYLTSILYVILYLIRLTSVKVVSVQSRFPLKINIWPTGVKST